MRIVKSPLCTFCKLYPESLVHLVFECSFVKDLWPYISNMLLLLSQSHVKVMSFNVILMCFSEVRVKCLMIYMFYLWQKENGLFRIVRICINFQEKMLLLYI